jgi:hypothetical protein
MQEALSAPLPEGAVTAHPTKPYLSNIKAIYVIERLNEVFGIGGWKQTTEILEADQKMVVVKSYLTVPEYGIELESYGGNDNPDRGDAYKGAVTDALTKMGSYLGIGAHVWKGEKVEEGKKPAKPVKAEAPKGTVSDKQLQLIADLMKSRNITREQLPAMGYQTLNKTNASELIKKLMEMPEAVNHQKQVTEEAMEEFGADIPF